MNTNANATRPRAQVALAAIPSGIGKLTKRLNELRGIEELELQEGFDRWGQAALLANRINATLDDVFGQGTAETQDFHISKDWFVNPNMHHHGDIVRDFMRGRDRAIAILNDAIDRLQEKATDTDIQSAKPRLAYENLTLHPEIAWAANDLYRDGHYANAVQDAVKALNGLVRLRSGLELDGVTLMQNAFGKNNPVLRFNDLSDESDRDEQFGFMSMFVGAVSGLRNPRAHGFIKDDPERALDFIAFVSLLAKLLDEAKKV